MSKLRLARLNRAHRASVRDVRHRRVQIRQQEESVSEMNLIGEPSSMTSNRRRYLQSRFCRRQASYLWSEKRIIKPVLLPIKFGDGKQVIAVRPITTRTHHYVVAINSTPDWFERGQKETLHDQMDAIYEEIGERFGDITGWYLGDDQREAHLGKCDPFKEWPAICLDIGTEWWRLN
jgi:hypothetical protein